jgi:hypothetical protein
MCGERIDGCVPFPVFVEHDGYRLMDEYCWERLHS